MIVHEYKILALDSIYYQEKRSCVHIFWNNAF